MSLVVRFLTTPRPAFELRCPFCREEPLGAVAECVACGALHHRECFEEYTRCAAGHCASPEARQLRRRAESGALLPDSSGGPRVAPWHLDGLRRRSSWQAAHAHPPPLFSFPFHLSALGLLASLIGFMVGAMLRVQPEHLAERYTLLTFFVPLCLVSWFGLRGLQRLRLGSLVGRPGGRLQAYRLLLYLWPLAAGAAALCLDALSGGAHVLACLALGCALDLWFRAQEGAQPAGA